MELLLTITTRKQSRSGATPYTRAGYYCHIVYTFIPLFNREFSVSIVSTLVMRKAATVTWKKFMDKYTGSRNTTEILLKSALNMILSISNETQTTPSLVFVSTCITVCLYFYHPVFTRKLCPYKFFFSKEN